MPSLKNFLLAVSLSVAASGIAAMDDGEKLAASGNSAVGSVTSAAKGSATGTARSTDGVKSSLDLCTTEALVGLDVARSFFANKHSKQHALDTAVGAGEFGQTIASNLFRRFEGGGLLTPYQFAQEAVFLCMKERRLPLDREMSKDAAQACFYRSEVIYYAYTLRAAGKSKEEARQQVAVIVKNRDVVSAAFLANMVEFIFKRPSNETEAASGRRSFVKTCLLNS